MTKIGTQAEASPRWEATFRICRRVLEQGRQSQKNIPSKAAPGSSALTSGLNEAKRDVPRLRA